MTDSELFVGQPVNWYGPGVVYTYQLNASGDWIEQSRLTASDAERKDDFGRAISVNGNTMVVGAPRKRDGSGVAYVFERASADAEWLQVSIIEPPAEGDHSNYASSVVMVSPNEVLVGAPAVDSTGVVYQMQRDGDEWTVSGILRAEEGSEMPGFGQTMTRQDGWLLVGAPGGRRDAGEAYFFQRQEDGSWAAAGTAGLPRALAGPRAGVGTAVVLDGDRAYIGVPGEATVFYFEKDDSDRWTQAGSLHPFDATGRATFGASIAVAGGELWVGAPRVNRGNGRVFRYVPDSSGGWQTVERFVAEGADGTAWPYSFGFAMVANQDRAVVSMPSRDFGEGRALAVSRAGGSWSEGQTLEGEIYRIGKNLTSGARCEDGQLEEFPCSNMELVSHMPISSLGGERGVWVNDVWGWTDRESGRNYALVARRDGASFVDVTDPTSPRDPGF
jgi:hypothetical protein